MSRPSGLVPLPGSARRPAGRRSLGPTDPAERIDLTVVLRRQRRGLLGADRSALRGVERFARSSGLEVTDADPLRRCVCLAGPAAACSAAFGVRLERFASATGEHRGHRGAVRVPGPLRPQVLAVLGFDDRPLARTQFRPFPSAPGIAARAAALSYAPPAVAALYGFPAGTDGSGQTIAFLELGGGYVAADLAAYFTGLGLPEPALEAHGVDGARNAATGNPNGPDGEVMLDLEVAGAIAPGARLAAWFAPNTDRGFLDGVTAAIHAPPGPTALSISWGAPEADWTGQARAALDAAFADAALLAVTVCCAAGDNGSSDGLADGRAHVDYPASSPQVLACGGTHLEGSGSTITAESVWDDGPGGGATGGGVSDAYPLPAWQVRAGVPPSANPGSRRGRGVPDVAGNADPQTGYRVRVDGRDAVYGGTSAVAPLWAALVARLTQAGGARLGWLGPRLYAQLAADLRDIRAGANGAYAAGPGWDACTGLGSPDGTGLAGSLGRVGGAQTTLRARPSSRA
ncbi:MAG: S53 family peptidase [Candidatus Limnocylindrales bacterium]